MKNATLFRLVAMLALVFVLSPNTLRAQANSNGATRLTFRVAGLTSATRDAIARDLGNEGHARLVFACVPAGILVFEPAHSASRQTVRDLTLPVIQQRAGTDTITELAISPQEAEAECAQVRDR